jgi:beta-glucosidase
VEVDATGVSTYRRVELELSGEIDFVIEYSRTRGYAAVRLGWELVDSEEFRRAVEEAKSADAVVFFAEVAEGEERDRAVLRLSRSQEQLIEKLLEVNRNVVVVLMTGSPVVGEWLYRVPAVVQAWYPGQEGGRAIADVLFGDYNPAGRLPFTWPHCEGQLPLYYNMKPSGRVYDYVNATGAPLYPFGHGLSYTKFEYSNLKIQVLEEGRLVKVSATVRNAGEREGDEVVQLYVRDAVASVARPLKELRGFKRVHLKPGEATTVEFTLMPDDLAFYDQRMRRIVEPGTFIVMVGSSSEDIRLYGEFELKKRFEAKFELEGVSARKSGEWLIVDAFVRNTGETTDVARVELRVDGALLEVYPVEVSPSERRSAIFRLRHEKVRGKVLKVAVDGQAASLEIS